jgi:hypothetical protein
MRIGTSTNSARTSRRATSGAVILLAVTLLGAALYFCRHGLYVENLFAPYNWRFGPGFGPTVSHQPPPPVPWRVFHIGPIVISQN